MAKTKNKRNTGTKSNDKLDTLKDLRMCKVVLHDIALDKDLVQLYQLHFSGNKKKELEHSLPCISMSENSSDNVQMLKENIWEDNTEAETSRLTRSRLKKLSKKQNEECKNVEFLDDVLYNQYHKVIQSGFIAQNQQLKYDTVKLFSSKSYDETSSASSYIYCSDIQKKTMLNDKKLCNNKRLTAVQKKTGLRYKRILQIAESGTSSESIKMSFESGNYFEEKNLSDADCDSKMEEVSNKSIVKPSNNLCTVINNGMVCNIRLERCKNIQNSEAASSIDTDVENKISETSEDSGTDFKSQDTNPSNILNEYNKINNRTQDKKDAKIRPSNKIVSPAIDNTILATSISESFASNSACPTMSSTNRIIKIPPDCLTTLNKNQCANETGNKKTTKKNLPKITEDHILPKGTIKIVKVNTNDESLQNSISEQVYLKPNRCNDANSITKQDSYINDSIKSTNILRKREYRTCEIIRSVDTLKISGSLTTSALNNNINLKNKNIDNIEPHNTKVDRRNVDSLVEIRNNIHNNVNASDIASASTEISENYTLKGQERSNRLDNDEEHENDILQGDKKCYKIKSCENVLNKDTSNLEDVGENSDINRSLRCVSTEEAIRQNRKRIAEENTIQLDKKRRLNRTIWQQHNVTHAKSLNCQERNGFQDIDTMVTEESPTSEENVLRQKTDLRERLNKNKILYPKVSTYENKFNNNKNSVESKQTDVNNKNDMNTQINTTKSEKYRKRLSFEEELDLNKTSCKEKVIQTNAIHNNDMHCNSPLQSTSEETQYLSQMDKNINESVQKERTNRINEDDDDDCISLFAESIDTNYGSTVINEENKPNKSLHFDKEYRMTASSFNKYLKQNVTEFNKEYAKYVGDNSIETSKKIVQTKREFNNQPRQPKRVDYACETKATSKVMPLETKNVEIPMYSWLKRSVTFSNRYCFQIMKKGICHKESLCRYIHEIQSLIDEACSKDPRAIVDIMQDALHVGYNCFFTKLYITSLQKLTVDQILMMYQLFQDIRVEMTNFSKKYIIRNIIKELLNRQLPLKTIVNYLVEHLKLIQDSDALINTFNCLENYIKPGEYWSTVRTLILRLPPDKHIIQKILLDCIKNKNLIDAEDINNNLISKVPFVLISLMDKDVLERFKSLLAEKTTNNSRPAILVRNFGENYSETIASPDGDTLSQTESPRCDNTFIKKSADKIKDYAAETNEVYLLQPIDDLPEAQSVYRDHKHLWKFYMDLHRFKTGLSHHDYDYVINILKNYAEKPDESSLFVRSCCSILRTEVKRSEYHLKNIIRRTVQMGTFDILGKILFDIGLNILTSLMDNEAWVLALSLIQSLNIHRLPCNAEYFLLLAETYLANKKAVKAYDLLKYKNIICTSRDKWYVKSTINDERVRSKIIHILLESFCNEFVEHAFCLFQFLLTDQSSQYYPIDLSRYVDKLIMSSLSKKDTNLITEMANLVLKYTFALSTTTCRALVSTLIHMDENLAKQIYNYAESIGIYSAMKLWPVTYITINTNLTEEEIYLTFLQLLKNLITNFGHAIEFAKPHQIKVYLILEIKSISKQFYYAKLQNSNNNEAITNIKILIKNVLKKRFDPPILLMRGSKGRIYKLQSKSVINYLKTKHCD